MKDNYNLLDGLFSNNITRTQEEKDKKSTSVKQRTFKISNEFWNDFVDLAAAKRLTQAELINQLIANVVKENMNEIEQYRAFFNKK